jgi:hypothetical protein
LITLNHTNVLEYGFSDFLKTIKVIQVLQKQIVMSVAGGLGLAFSNKKEQEKFFK